MRKSVSYGIFTLLLFLISINIVSEIISNKATFFNNRFSTQYESLRSAYYSSQYVKKVNPGIINDEVFEAFAGGVFLKGLNPILIVHDHPPLGRYLVSLSILLFDNAATIILFLMAFSFLGIYLISLRILKNKFLALIPLAIFMNEPLVLNKFVFAPLPEPIQFPFIVFSLYFFMVAVKSNRKFLFYGLVSLSLGFVISTRFFVTGAGLVSAMFAYLLIFKKNRRDILFFLPTLPLAVLVLILSYLRTLFDGYSIFDIFGIQKYILFYHKSKFINAFSFWDLILFNRWHTWWDGNKILSDNQWIFAWPIAVIMGFFYSALRVLKRIKMSNEEEILLFWLGTYCLILSTGYTSTRYFLPILPFLYILTTIFLVKVYKFVINRKK